MGKVIKNLKVTWTWQGDEFALKGFNLALCEKDKLPTDESVYQVFAVFVGKSSYRDGYYQYIIKNLILNGDLSEYRIYVQAVYQNGDSDWVSVGGIQVSDDGTNTIETEKGSQGKTDAVSQKIKDLAEGKYTDTNPESPDTLIHGRYIYSPYIAGLKGYFENETTVGKDGKIRISGAEEGKIIIGANEEITIDPTDGIKSSNYQLKMDGGFRFGNTNSNLTWDTSSGQLKLKGILVQTPAGEEVPITVHRGDYSSLETYYKNDTVTLNGTTYNYINSTPSSVSPPNSTYWSVYAARGQDGQNASIWTIVNDYWYKDGVNTGQKAIGEDGRDGDTWTIGSDGYWYLNSAKTDKKAIGEDGATGVGIISVTEYYLASTESSGVTTSTPDWTTTIQTITSSKRYLWNYEKITYTNETSVDTTPVIIGVYGDKGDTGNSGKGISAITNYYLATSDFSGVTKDTSGWTTTVQVVTPTNKYLWNYEKIDYIDPVGTSLTTPAIIGVYGDKGDKGDPGANAPLIKLSGATQIISVSNTGTITPSALFTVVATPVNTSVTSWTYSVDGGSFTTTLPTGITRSGNTVTINPSTSTFKTLTIKASDVSISDSFTIARAVDGAKGQDGTDGADAYTILLTNESHTFAGSTNAAVAGSTTTSVIAYKGSTSITPSSISVGTKPTGMTSSVSGTTITFNVTTSMISASGSIPITITVDGKTFIRNFSYAIAFKGDTGLTGATGTGISSITEEYYLSTSKTTQTGGSWVTTPPEWEYGKYIWTRSKIIYSNPTSTVYTTPIVSSEWEAVENIEVGGRNLVLASAKGWHTTTYNVVTGYLSEDWEEGATYTISFKGTINAGQSFGLWRDLGSKTVFTGLTPDANGICRRTFVCPAPYSPEHPTDRFSIFNYPSSGATSATIEWIKLEKGNKATDWTPAPEDVQGQIDKSVKSTDVEYYLSTSLTSLSGGSWQTTAPTWVDGKYMWSRTKVVLNDGTISYTPSATGTCIAGAKGDKGDKGDIGTSKLFRGAYSSSTTYSNTADIQDVVKHDNKYWLCIGGQGTVTRSTPSDISSDWKILNSFENLATGFLLAEDASVTKTLNVGQGGTSRAGVSGKGDYRFWAGDESPADAPFSVDEDGNATVNSMRAIDKDKPDDWIKIDAGLLRMYKNGKLYQPMQRWEIGTITNDQTKTFERPFSGVPKIYLFPSSILTYASAYADKSQRFVCQVEDVTPTTLQARIALVVDDGYVSEINHSVGSPLANSYSDYDWQTNPDNRPSFTCPYVMPDSTVTVNNAGRVTFAVSAAAYIFVREDVKDYYGALIGTTYYNKTADYAASFNMILQTYKNDAWQDIKTWQVTSSQISEPTQSVLYHATDTRGRIDTQYRLVADSIALPIGMRGPVTGDTTLNGWGTFFRTEGDGPVTYREYYTYCDLLYGIGSMEISNTSDQIIQDGSAQYFAIEQY